MSQQNNEQTELLREILKWIKFSGMKDVAPILESRLENEKKRQIYQYSDGTKSAREISKIIDISFKQVSVYWREWMKPPALGETILVAGKNRFRRSFDLLDFGLISTKEEEESTETKVAEDKDTAVEVSK